MPTLATLGDVIVYSTTGDVIVYSTTGATSTPGRPVVQARHYPTVSQWTVPPGEFEVLQRMYPSERSQRPHSGRLAAALAEVRPTAEHMQRAMSYVRTEGVDLTVSVRPPDAYMDMLNEYRASPVPELVQVATACSSPRWVLAGLLCLAGTVQGEPRGWTRATPRQERVPNSTAVGMYATPAHWAALRAGGRHWREAVRMWLQRHGPTPVMLAEAAEYVQTAHRAAQVGLAGHAPLTRENVYVSQALAAHIKHQAAVRRVSRQVYIVASLAQMAGEAQ